MIGLDYKVAVRRINEYKCPVCGSSNRERDYDFISGDHVRYYCLDCRCRWEDSNMSYYSFNIYDSEFNEIDIKNNLGIIGHIPEILETLLNMSEMLPAFMGIDKGLDRFIMERLKE